MCHKFVHFPVTLLMQHCWKLVNRPFNTTLKNALKDLFSLPRALLVDFALLCGYQILVNKCQNLKQLNAVMLSGVLIQF